MQTEESVRVVHYKLVRVFRHLRKWNTVQGEKMHVQDEKRKTSSGKGTEMPEDSVPQDSAGEELHAGSLQGPVDASQSARYTVQSLPPTFNFARGRGVCITKIIRKNVRKMDRRQLAKGKYTIISFLAYV